MVKTIKAAAVLLLTALPVANATDKAPYPVPDTMQTGCYNAITEIACPRAGKAFAGQDAQHRGTQPSFTDNGDGTTTDKVTGLMWAKSPDLNGDGVINVADRLSYEDAASRARDFSLTG